MVMIAALATPAPPARGQLHREAAMEPCAFPDPALKTSLVPLDRRRGQATCLDRSSRARRAAAPADHVRARHVLQDGSAAAGSVAHEDAAPGRCARVPSTIECSEWRT